MWSHGWREKEERRIIIQDEIDSFVRWCGNWKLIMNYKKCEVIAISRQWKIKMNDYYINKNNGETIKLKKICNNNLRSDEEMKDDTKKESKFRMLGFHYSCKGKMDVMIDRFIGLCNLQFMHLRRYVNYNNLRLNSAAIWKLGQPVISALIQFGSKFYSKEAKHKLQRIYNWQYKFARYCIGARQSCPKRYLEYELNFISPEIRVEQAVIDHYEQSKRSPMTHMKGFIFDQWMGYCGFYCYDDMIEWKHKQTTQNKSLLSRGYKTWLEINEINEQNWSIIQPNQTKELKYSIPIYTSVFPPNVSIFERFDEIKYQIRNDNSFNWWTDGSVIEGNYGGFGYLTMQQRGIGKWTANYGWIDHKTNIDYCELVAILEVLKEAINDDQYLNNKDSQYLTILTDSAFCLSQFNEQRYCKYEYYYNVLMKIFKLCHILDCNGKDIRVVKVPAHQGITGNELADYWAKTGAYTARDLDEYGYISENDIPLSVQKEINKNFLKIQNERKRKEKRESDEKKARDKGKKRIGSCLYESHLVYGSKHVFNEKKYLSFNQAAIIARLRSEHIELNYYTSIIHRKGEKTTENCTCCHVPETVTHFLIECRDYTIERNALIDELREISDELIDNNNKIKVKRILFYHCYQESPRKQESLMERVKILRAVCNYVVRTKRFERENVRTNIFKQFGRHKKEKEKIDLVMTQINDLNLDSLLENDEIDDNQMIEMNERFLVQQQNEVSDDNG